MITGEVEGGVTIGGVASAKMLMQSKFPDQLRLHKLRRQKADLQQLLTLIRRVYHN